MKKAWLSLFVATLLQGFTASADLWTVSQQWSPEMEIQYQQWVEANAKVDMFSRQFMDAAKTVPNPYYGLTTDCADTVYALRVIFSYENKLPWAVRNPGYPNKLITQATKRYDTYPEGPERLKAFFFMLFDAVGTSSIANDTYPVSIDKIHSGVILLTSKINHHSWTIAGIDTKGNPRLIYNSTVGKKSGSRLQQRSSWPNPHWVFQPEEKLSDPANPDSEKIKVPVFLPDSYAGFRYWVPVEKLLTNFKNLPDYSNDQYDLNLVTWKQTIQNKLATTKESMQEVVERLLRDACDDVKQRIAAINEVEEFKKDLRTALTKESVLAMVDMGVMPEDEGIKELTDILKEIAAEKTELPNKQCLVYKRFDQYSTPSRDKRLFDAVMLARSYFVHAIKKQGPRAFTDLRLKQFKKIFSRPDLSAKEESALGEKAVLPNELSICKLRFGKETVDMAEIKRRLFRSQLSSNPNEDVTGRWGGRGTQKSELAQMCPMYGDVYNPYDLDKAEAETQDEVQHYGNQTESLN